MFLTLYARQHGARNMSRYRGAYIALILAYQCVPSVSRAEDSSSGHEELSLVDLFSIEVTTASKTAEKLSDAPGVISVVTQEELQRFGGTTLRDILNRVPSLISSTTAFSDRSTIASRGDQIRNDSGHVLVLINGRPTRESLQGGVTSEIFQAFPINVIERLEIIRGPGSVLYGSSAFSAVINIITQRPETDLTVTVTGSGGSPLGSQAHYAKTLAKVGELEIVAAANFVERTGWDTRYSYAPPSTVVATTQDITIPSVATGAYLGLRYDGLTFSGNFDRWRHSYFWQGVVGENDWQRVFGDVGYDLNLSESLNWDISAHVTYTRATTDSSEAPGLQRTSEDIMAEVTTFLRPLSQVGIVAGVTYSQVTGSQRIEQSGRGLTVSDASRSNTTAYAQADYRPFPSVKLVAGVHLSLYENSVPKAVPRLGAIWTPVDGLTFKALYAGAFRAPSINETELRQPDLLGQPDLKPETVEAVDLGITYTGKQFNLGLNYFHTHQKEVILIDSRPTAVIGAPPVYANLGQAQISGFEFEGKYYPTPDILLTGSTLYFESEDRDGYTDITPIASLGTKAGLSYLSFRGLTASVFHIYQAPLDNSYASRLNPQTTAYHLLSAHLRLDLAKQFRLRFAESLSTFLYADNLLGTEVFRPDWGGVISETIPAEAGRTVFLGVSGTIPY